MIVILYPFLLECDSKIHENTSLAHGVKRTSLSFDKNSLQAVPLRFFKSFGIFQVYSV